MVSLESIDIVRLLKKKRSFFGNFDKEKTDVFSLQSSGIQEIHLGKQLTPNIIQYNVYKGQISNDLKPIRIYLVETIDRSKQKELLLND